jgi:hypothetical protein
MKSDEKGLIKARETNHKSSAKSNKFAYKYHLGYRNSNPMKIQ